MSWSEYVEKKIINYTTEEGHTYSNACSEGAIVGLDGTVWAVSSGLKLESAEITAINNYFKTKGQAASALTINKKKYLVTCFNADSNSVYLKCNGGGACIAMTTKAFILGTYDVSKKMSQDGTEKTQNVGYCNSAVENLQQQLLSSGY